MLQDGELAYIARYALGRDYHKLLRQRLKRLAERISAAGAPHGYRVFVDSAPVLEKPLAAAAGLGWQGKHTNLINRQAGSWFLLGEIYTDLPLPLDEPVTDHCGSCRACLDVCPTGAIIAPYLLDARRCISYFTIETRGPIPVEFRKQPWATGSSAATTASWCARGTATPGRRPSRTSRPGTASMPPQLTDLFGWSEEEWSERTAGSALRRPGYLGWLRNIAVALGNAPSSAGVIEALEARAGHPSELVREHVAWALEQHAPPAA